ncbi:MULTISPECIES: type VI secretion system baseplate subunit TssE [Cupriavidus]
MPRSPGQGSLFERLDPDLPPRRLRSRQELAAARISAVKRHLAWMLNTRRGSSQSCPGLGLADINDAAISSSDLQEQVCEDIRLLVATYEPRVKVIDVQPRTDTGMPSELHFRLRCLVPVDNLEELVEIDMDIGGHDKTATVT